MQTGPVAGGCGVGKRGRGAVVAVGAGPGRALFRKSLHVRAALEPVVGGGVYPSERLGVSAE